MPSLKSSKRRSWKSSSIQYKIRQRNKLKRKLYSLNLKSYNLSPAKKRKSTPEYKYTKLFPNNQDYNQFMAIFHTLNNNLTNIPKVVNKSIAEYATGSFMKCKNKDESVNDPDSPCNHVIPLLNAYNTDNLNRCKHCQAVLCDGCLNENQTCLLCKYKCSVCEGIYQRSDFSKSQFAKRGKRKCGQCAANAIAKNEDDIIKPIRFCCSNCSRSFRKEEYLKSEWIKQSNRKCTACVAITKNVIPVYKCGICQMEFQRSGYLRSEWKKGTKRKCNNCVAAGKNEPKKNECPLNFRGVIVEDIWEMEDNYSPGDFDSGPYH